MRQYLSNRFVDELLAEHNQPNWETSSKYDWSRRYHAIDREISDVLERLHIIGKLSDDPPIVALSVPFDVAFEEVKNQMERSPSDRDWENERVRSSGPGNGELTETQFRRSLEKNEIYNLPRIDDLIK